MCNLAVKKLWKNGHNYYLMYTICFCLACLGVYIWFLCGHRTFIWHADGWKQHYKALVYYAQYLRTIIRGIIYEHELMIPNWDFALGEGGDVLQTLHYYVIGDPIAALSVFVPTSFLHIFYNLSILIRLYLAGIAFSCLCFKVGNKNKYGILAGTMSYLFCFWSMYASVTHPYFLAPMIYLPLLLLGVEKIIRREKTVFFPVIVFLSAISNLYFFYMLALITVIFVIVRLVLLYKRDYKKIFSMILRIGILAMLGVGMAAIVFAPMCYAFLNNGRLGSDYIFRNLFYPLSYYSQLLGLYISKGSTYKLYMGFSIPTLLAVLLLFRKKNKFREIKCLFILCIIFIVFPVFGQIFNGFSYMSNRWCFAFSCLSAYILTVMWPYLMRMKKEEVKFLFCSITVYYILCMVCDYSRKIDVFTAIVLGYVFLFVLLQRVFGSLELQNKRKNEVGLCIVVASIFVMAFWRFSSAEYAGNVASEGVEARNAEYQVLKMNEASAIKDWTLREDSEGFHRYSGRDLTSNAGALAGISSTQYYWSLSNPYVSKYREELELLETGQSFCYEGYDDRTFMTTLASADYYATPSYHTTALPYGWSYVMNTDVKGECTQAAIEALQLELGTKELSDRQLRELEGTVASWWSIYKNDYALPLAYSYDTYMLCNDSSLSAVEKQEAMLQTVFLNKEPSLVEKGVLELTCKSIPFEIVCDSNEVSMKDNKFIVTADKASVTLNLKGMPDSETYFTIKGLEFDGVSDYELYLGGEDIDPYNFFNRVNWDLLSYSRKKAIKREKLFWEEPEETSLGLNASNGVYKSMNYKTPSFTWYHDRHDFSANLSYSEEAITSIKITFSRKGVYSYDTIDVVCQPMGKYVERVEKLKYCTLENLVVDNDVVSGTMNTEIPRMLCFSIPYSSGWKAYVDGQRVDIYQANTAYMAIEVEEGKHEIKLVYDTPLLKIGFGISIISFAIFCFWFMVQRKKILQSGKEIE